MMGSLMHDRDAKANVQPIGRVNVEVLKTVDGESIPMLHNAGFALTASAMTELTTLLAQKTSLKSLRLKPSQVKGVLDGYRLPPGCLELLVIQPFSSADESPWVLMKAGKPNLAGVEVDMFELLDPDVRATRQIIEYGLMRWL